MENWKTINGFNESYMISDLGNVKSLKGKKERFLKKCIHKDGYEFVNLYLNGKSKYSNIHTLVAVAFLGYNPDGTLKIVVDHKNNIQSDNKVSNLQLTTQRINTSKDKKGTSKYVGVHWSKIDKKWRASIFLNGKLIYLGRFDNEIDAHNAYQNKLKLL